MIVPAFANEPLAPIPASIENAAPAETVSVPSLVTLNAFAPPYPDVEGEGIVSVPLTTEMLPARSLRSVPEK